MSDLFGVHRHELVIKIELGDKLAALAEHFCSTPRLLRKIHRFLEEYKTEMSEAINNLRDAVDSDITAKTEGFQAFDEAFAELVSDIQGLPTADDVTAEANRIAANASAMQTAFATAAQQIRDAIPTAEPTPDNPTDSPDTGTTDTGDPGGTGEPTEG
jgi:hypothetical protein